MRYRITFTPQEPYFFGNEKAFKYPGQDNSGKYGNLYFIKSETIPSQSTILGALRYMLLPVKRSDFSYTSQEIEENTKAVGRESFDIDSKFEQSFGAIKSLSPMFIVSGEKMLVPAPLDHNLCMETGGSSVKYKPFSNYSEMSTPEGIRLFAADYNAKEGSADGMFMDVSDGSLKSYADLFYTEVRIGINRRTEKKGLFKKEFCMLKDGMSFAAETELDEGLLSQDVLETIDNGTYVYLGQNRSVFTVGFESIDDGVLIENATRSCLEKSGKRPCAMLYFMGDSLAFEGMYNEICWANVMTKDYRSFMRNTGEGGKVRKGSILYKMIKAGSVLLTDDPSGWLDAYSHVPGYENAKNIGYCNILVIGG